MPEQPVPPQLTEEQQLRVRRIRKLCDDFIDKLAEHQISVWEVINQNGALSYISNAVQGRPIMPMNELGQPAVYTKPATGDKIDDLDKPAAEVKPVEAAPAAEQPAVETPKEESDAAPV